MNSVQDNVNNTNGVCESCCDEGKSKESCLQTPKITVTIIQKEGVNRRQSKQRGQITLPPIHRRATSFRNADKGHSTHFSSPVTPLRRKCRDFKGPPRAQPLTVVFNAEHNSLDHRSVLDMVKRRLSYLPAGQRTVVSVRCEVRNVILGSVGLPDRWHVRVGCAAALRELLRGLHSTEESYVVRLLDTVVQEEYRTFLRLQNMTAEIMSLAI